ncbi:DNA-3-methyladenine glycosylase [Methylopila jiangsuensis]|uniref:DNA-3-methyladenine glycosylase I n=1 Tax=Methylopila jiangsuensis TaxID=586230 RepID=A0A9W6JK91_9HYPH|nr:DNA-3-methyladenine glycosylase I [Methylopila jiangsuensis]MDR6284680.1 DNA-3-methyladenine glycosylase I [Methylopila jiangsuensis]GLK77931.1 DNA-3-methyladenine glycosylase [Methylopila jiangsuensis]
MSESAPLHPDGHRRCRWCGTDPFYVAYHDDEWGRPERDPRALYEKLMLDGFQAGLAWITILRKRDGFRAAFQGFDPEIVARFGEDDVARLLGDAGIVRSRLKIEGAVKSARAYLAMRDRGEDFSDYLWGFVDGAPIVNRWREIAEVPASTPLSETLSRDLKRRGFTFCGPVIVYAFMQAVGMVDDHLTDCFRHGG